MGSFPETLSSIPALAAGSPEFNFRLTASSPRFQILGQAYFGFLAFLMTRFQLFVLILICAPQ